MDLFQKIEVVGKKLQLTQKLNHDTNTTVISIVIIIIALVPLTIVIAVIIH